MPNILNGVFKLYGRKTTKVLEVVPYTLMRMVISLTKRYYSDIRTK